MMKSKVKFLKCLLNFDYKSFLKKIHLFQKNIIINTIVQYNFCKNYAHEHQ